MLTRSQIQRMAQRNHISAQSQERDYLQQILLYLLYLQTQAFIFKGGTALRMAYRGNRYSEDLDFNGSGDIKAIQKIWGGLIPELLSFGVQADLRNEWISEVGYSMDISYQGPLYDGRDRTKGKVRIDISLRQEMVAAQRILLTPEYDDLRPFVVTVITPEHMLAEKVRALLVRGKPRDVYDIWLLHQQGVPLDGELAAAKLALYQIPLTNQAIKDALDKASVDWERDLRPLLPQYIPWEVVARELSFLTQ